MFCLCVARTAAECRRGMVLVSVCMLEEEKSFSYISREAERQSSLQKAIFFIDTKIVLSEKSPAAAPAVSTGNMCRLLQL